MEDKTFAQAIEALHQRALKEITDEALSCWPTIQQGATVASATASITNEHKREAVTHILLYVQLQSLLFDAKHRQIISQKRYDELREYVDLLNSLVKQQPFVSTPFPVTEPH